MKSARPNRQRAFANTTSSFEDQLTIRKKAWTFQDEQSPLCSATVILGASEGPLTRLILALAFLLIGFSAWAANPYVCRVSLVTGRETAECQNADVELFDLTADDWNGLVCGMRTFALQGYVFYREVNGDLRTSIDGAICTWEIESRP